MGVTRILKYFANIEENELYWLAGIWEGEGCFTLNGTCPVTHMTSTDYDLALYISSSLSCSLYVHNEAHDNCKKAWRAYMSGEKAIEFMLLLKPLLFSRRQKRIDEIVQGWNPTKTKLSNAEKMKIKDLSRAGLTQTEIGEVVGRPQRTVGRVLENYVY